MFKGPVIKCQVPLAPANEMGNGEEDIVSVANTANI